MASDEPPLPPEEDIFLRALEQPDAKRAEFVDAQCGDDSGLRRAVDALLTDHHRASAFFAETTRQLTVPPEAELALPQLGQQVGPYRLVRRLGEGGGGVVFEAEQEVPVPRKVALKCLRGDFGDESTRARFAAEVQTLALMDHPNVARVLDAGTTATGFPFIVMELVAGLPVTTFVREQGLSIEQRLALFGAICAGVQHAHQKGVLHLDLKPSNILVAWRDGVPVPKVIDFGIARALDVTLDGAGGGRAPECLAGTPSYMSPEQWDGRIELVDTRSDIYSLGVILNELLTGAGPSPVEHAQAAGAIRPAARPAPPSRRGAGVRDELDAMVRHALAHHPEQRYPTVRAFAADVENYLAHRPVDACPSSFTYRLRKRVRRNRLAAGAVALAVFVLVVGCVVTTLLYIRAVDAEKVQARLRASAEEREHVARAAILLMQSRPEAADAEIRRMGGVLTQPSVEASQVFHSLGLWSAMNGDWKTSSERWLALSRVNRFDDRDMTDNATRDSLPVAPTLLEAGDVATFETFRGELITRLQRTPNPIAAEQVLKITLHRPAPPEVLASLAALAEVAERSLPGGFQKAPVDWLEAWRCVVLGLWHLRQGHPDLAAAWCDRALLLRDAEDARRAVALLVLGLARRQGGAPNSDVEAAISEAKRLVAERFAHRIDYGTGGYWHDWLFARLLVREVDHEAASDRLR